MFRVMNILQSTAAFLLGVKATAWSEELPLLTRSCGHRIPESGESPVPLTHLRDPKQLHAGAGCSEERWTFGLLLLVLVKYSPHQEWTHHLGMPLNAPYLTYRGQLSLGRVQTSQTAGGTKYRLRVFWRNAVSPRRKEAWDLALWLQKS